MQRMPSTGADLSNHDIVQVIKRAEIARSEFLRERPAGVLKALGVSVSVFGLAFLLVVGARWPRHQLFENTVGMERLATSLGQAETISIKTVNEISYLLRQPEYDCRQLSCDPWLEKRNFAARGRLQTALARSALQAEAAFDR